MAHTPLHTAEQAAAWITQQLRGRLVCDSRAVQPGDAFIAWPGAAHDGRRYVAAALQAGAVACLVEAEGAEAFGFDDPRIATLPALKAQLGTVASLVHGHPSRQLKVIATTGTNGKTSTAWWTAQGLSHSGRRCGLVGTLGIGEPGRLVDAKLTTPDPVRLQQAFAGFVAEGLQACAIEASSIGIVEQRLAGTAIDTACFTNLTQDHLDYHGSMQAYWAAKRALFDWPGLRSAVVNIDDPMGARLARELEDRALALWTVSLHGPARLRASGLRHAEPGLAFEVLEGEQQVPVQTRLVGKFNASNVMVVLAAMRAQGVPLAEAAAAVSAFTAVPGRLQRVPAAAHEPVVLVDYAHTPDALDKVLRALRPLADARQGRLWCLFGCGGDRDPGKRPLMGAIAARAADRVMLTSDNPRGEAPAVILAQILAGVTGHDDVDVIEDRARAIHDVIQRAADADVVLLAGKGHEDYQEVAGVRRPFSDIAQAGHALAERRTAMGAAT